MSSVKEVNAAFDHAMLKVLDVNKVGEKVRKYLYDLNALNLPDTALLADEEKDVWSCMCEPAGLNASVREDAGQKIAVKRLWPAARRVFGSTDPTSMGSSRAVEDDEALLLPGTGETLQELWLDRHKFHLNRSRLVAEGLFNKMHRRIHSKPKKLESPMLEKARLQNRPHLDSARAVSFRATPSRSTRRCTRLFGVIIWLMCACAPSLQPFASSPSRTRRSTIAGPRRTSAASSSIC